MKWNKKFKYPASTRSLIRGSRHYDIQTEDSGFEVVEKLPSVTTILSATQPEEKL
jgi:genome maintenance exonuclease 1